MNYAAQSNLGNMSYSNLEYYWIVEIIKIKEYVSKITQILDLN
jgi:hypothetical protein